MQVNGDLHLHGPYSMGTSNKLTLASMAEGAASKGVELLGTGDCLHNKWLSEIKQLEAIDDGTFQLNKTRFILTVEVEDMRRVHHLIIFPSLSKVYEFKEAITGFARNLNTDGRPHLSLSGEEIVELTKDVDALIGPCHAFTPWTALYAYHPNLRSCYGSQVFKIDFVELGLSANSEYADRIAELHPLTFLTNSDAHSTAHYRLAREFNRFEVEDITFQEIRKAIKREGGRKIVLNVGLPPSEGKYNRTACTRCYHQFTVQEAEAHKWKCPKCQGTIKKGVWDRVNELANWTEPRHPDYRPPYMEIIPLGEIIALALGMRSPDTNTVQKQRSILVEAFGSEINALVDAPMDELRALSGLDKRVKDMILAFRQGNIKIIPGGGGKYGELILPGHTESTSTDEKSSHGKPKQKTLFDF